jgi:hypothetical protein
MPMGEGGQTKGRMGVEGGGNEQQGEVAVRWREEEGKKKGE